MAVKAAGDCTARRQETVRLMATALGASLDAEAGLAGVAAALPPQYVDFKEQIRLEMAAIKAKMGELRALHGKASLSKFDDTGDDEVQAGAAEEAGGRAGGRAAQDGAAALCGGDWLRSAAAFSRHGPSRERRIWLLGPGSSRAYFFDPRLSPLHRRPSFLL